MLSALATGYFILVILCRVYLAWLGARQPYAAPVAPPATLGHEPVVTILLPLYREPECLPTLLQSIRAIDYPTDRLDVKLILEEDDPETRAEALRLGLPDHFDLIIVPDAAPRTKPKACNFALAYARGDFVVIYDAEDIPDPDQVRKAIAAFACGPDKLVCMQARLNYYNAEENWLTRLFALEYALWFDNLLPALHRLGAPIPLGGTSNFFRTARLRELGAWDPFNVTEDADLGMRIARAGYRTGLLESTTYEEANCRVGNWLRQRSRWIKGYLQTWLVHTRTAPRMTLRDAARDWLSCHLFLGGAVFSALIHPFLWMDLLSRFVRQAPIIDIAYPQPLLVLNVLALTFGNLVFMTLAATAPVRRGWTHLSAWAALTPLYWALTSIAAYKALWQIVRKPSFWEKTDHGISAEAAALRAAALHALDPPNAAARASRAA